MRQNEASAVEGVFFSILSEGEEAREAWLRECRIGWLRELRER